MRTEFYKSQVEQVSFWFGIFWNGVKIHSITITENTTYTNIRIDREPTGHARLEKFNKATKEEFFNAYRKATQLSLGTEQIKMF